MIPALEPAEFSEFFRAVHGTAPFPWQQRLAEQVFTRGWPAALDVPTGAGKTASIDIAVFHLALQADWGAKRVAAVRTVFVVDRRLVVDDAAERAHRIALALQRAEDGILGRTAHRLGLLAEDPSRPLVVSRLRGGIPQEPDWVRTPSQPAVVVSTVDQAGSRLLFRGYGVSDSMKPVHAGLLGSDALFLLDEAHLSQPFVDTIRSAREFQQAGPHSDDAAPASLSVVTLSATQIGDAPALLQADDRGHPALGPRLKASKPVDLVQIKDELESPAGVRTFVDQAWAYSSISGGAALTVAIVVNRVKRARAIAQEMNRRLQGAMNGDQAEVALLIGRSRPLDRDRLVHRLLPRIAANRRAEASERPLFVIATQCIEAGADLDFDALVSEIAPLDSLRQRFGRLNRMGRAIEANGAIIGSSTQTSARGEEDPIYGRALAATWKLLGERARKVGRGRAGGRTIIDFGVDASREWLPQGPDLEPFLAPRAQAPVLMPAFVQQWCCTSPIPGPDPEVGLFLHGPEAGPADVQVVWRADLNDGDDSEWIPRVAVCPPSSLEAISVPYFEVQRWLRSAAVGDIADVERSPLESPAVDGVAREPLRWCGADDERTKRIRPNRVRPGDLLVVPSGWGGADEAGWHGGDAGGTGPVSDLGREANRIQRGRDILRLSPAIVTDAWRESAPKRVPPVASALAATLDSLSESGHEEIKRTLVASSVLPESWKDWLMGEAFSVLRDESGRLLAVERRVKGVAEAFGEPTTESDRSSLAWRRIPITLIDHSRGVSDLADHFAEQVGLPQKLAKDVRLAAYLHDAGKAHPSFQLWLYGGDELASEGGEPLAKSGRLSLSRISRERAGLLPGARHEVASLLFATEHPRLREAHDPDLVLWLIGTHHGKGRPFFSPVQWPAAGERFGANLGDGQVLSARMPNLAALTAWWLELQQVLTRRYGAWGLARLEAILRLADHRRSEREQEGA